MSTYSGQIAPVVPFVITGNIWIAYVVVDVVHLPIYPHEAAGEKKGHQEQVSYFQYHLLRGHK